MTSLCPLNFFSAGKVLLSSGGTFLLPRCHLYGGVTNVNFYTAPASVRAQFHTLPETLEDAKTAAAGSDFIARCLPRSIIEPYTR